MLEAGRYDAGSHESTRLFPLRPAEEVGEQARKIKEYIDGEKKPVDLVPADFKNLQEFEASLSKGLEPIAKLNVKFQLIYLDFFLTATGTAMLAADFPGETIPTDLEGLKMFFYSKQACFNAKENAKIKQKYESESLKATNAELSKRLLSATTESGHLDITSAQPPQVLTVILNPDLVRKKWETLRSLRKKLQDTEKTLNNPLEGEPDSENLRIAKREIIVMYRHRINEILMQLYGDLYLLKSKERVLGRDGLTSDEAELTKDIKGFAKLDRSLSLLDKMLRGVGELEGDRSYRQISSSTREAAREIIDILRPLEEGKKNEAMRSKGVDPNKVLAKTNYITAKERKLFGDTVLNHYGRLSAVPVGPDTLERSGAADDGGWQFVTGTTNTMAVDPTKRIIKDATQDRSVDEALAVGTSHEVEGHGVQAMNRETIPLAIMQGTNTDRRTVMAESGAVNNEKWMNQAMLGFNRYSSGVDSIAGLEARLQGKSYLECVEIIYESKMKDVRTKYDLSKPDQKEAFLTAARKILDGVIERAKRLFRSTDTKLIGLDRQSKYITNSQEAAYTEQEIVFDKLKELGLEKLAYLGLNLRTVLALLKLGLLDLNKVKMPEFKTLELWEKGGIGPNGEVIAPVKDRFTLDETA